MRPPRSAPSKPGKNKGAGLGFRSGVVPALSFRVSSPVYRRFANATYKPEAVLYAAVFRPGVRLGPPPCVGYGCFHAHSRQYHGQAHAVHSKPLKSLPVMSRQSKMPKLHLSQPASATATRHIVAVHRKGTKRHTSGFLILTSPRRLLGVKGFLCPYIFRFTQTLH